MVKNYFKTVLLFIFLFNGFLVKGQTQDPFLLANNQDTFIDALADSKKSAGDVLRISANETLTYDFNIKRIESQNTSLIGTVNNNPLSTISLYKVDGNLKGNIVIPDEQLAYSIYTEKNKVFIVPQDINDIVCSDYVKNTTEPIDNSQKSGSAAVPILESNPGGIGIIYLDFDGEEVSGTDWKGGAYINALSPNFSDQKITAIWKIMSEDFQAFNFNVTTNRALFDAAPVNRRMMVIFTPTDDAAPGSGGVAWVGSFSAGGSYGNNPCWAYNSGTRSAGETGSHEVGHTLGLYHDGSPTAEYYSGHGEWSPIMGWSASRSLGHWSKGEYPGATNQQDDIEIIAGPSNNIGFKTDDHANTIANATPLNTSPSGTVSSTNNNGVIANRTDKDIFSFNIETGDVEFNINPSDAYPNLNIQARIINAIGTEVAFSDSSGLSTTITANLPEGNYYLEIDGVGKGNLTTGYSDYSSIGYYSISGSYILGDNSQPPISNFSANTSCGTVQFQDASTNLVVSYLWDFGDNTTSTERNPTHTYVQNGSYTVSLKTTNNSGESTETKNNFITIDIPGQPIARDQTVCNNEVINLLSSGSKQYRWYDAPNGGNLIHTGANLTLDPINTDKTYYIEGFSSSCITSTRTEVKVTVAPTPLEPIIEIKDEKLLSIEADQHTFKWYFNGVLIEGATESSYLPAELGDYKVEVTNSSGCTNISQDYTVDLSQLNLSQDTYIFKYYPNPTKDILTIEGLTYREKKITLINTSGQTIFEGIPRSEMDLSLLSNGLYFILINEIKLGKLIKE